MFSNIAAAASSGESNSKPMTSSWGRSLVFMHVTRMAFVYADGGQCARTEENNAGSERSARASVCYAIELDQPVLVM